MTTRTAFILRADATLAVFQRPEDRLDYALDYAELVADGDSLAASTWSITGTLTLSDESQSGAVVSVTVEGTQGSVTNVVETAQGRRKAVTFCVIPPPIADCA
jgi:hypothetical protein